MEALSYSEMSTTHLLEATTSPTSLPILEEDCRRSPKDRTSNRDLSSLMGGASATPGLVRTQRITSIFKTPSNDASLSTTSRNTSRKLWALPNTRDLQLRHLRRDL